jgi:hypothetical protein
MPALPQVGHRRLSFHSSFIRRKCTRPRLRSNPKQGKCLFRGTARRRYPFVNAGSGLGVPRLSQKPFPLLTLRQFLGLRAQAIGLLSKSLGFIC